MFFLLQGVQGLGISTGTELKVPTASAGLPEDTAEEKRVKEERRGRGTKV